jgi:hypothetical protein
MQGNAGDIAEIIVAVWLTALAEITGCYLPWLWLKQQGSSGYCCRQPFAAAVCLVADLASGSGWACLCRLRRCLCGGGLVVAVAG